MSAVRTRQRDEEAARFAEETIRTLDVAPKNRASVFLGIFRGFAQGKTIGFKSRDAEVEGLHNEVRDLQEKLDKAIRANNGNGLRYATNFSPKEVEDILVWNRYGMDAEQIAVVMSCEPVEIEEVLENSRNGANRFGRQG